MIPAISSSLAGLAANTALVDAAAGNLARLNTSGSRDASAAVVPEANPDPAGEMVNLIRGQRGFQASCRTLRTAADLLGSILDILA